MRYLGRYYPKQTTGALQRPAWDFVYEAIERRLRHVGSQSGLPPELEKEISKDLHAAIRNFHNRMENIKPEPSRVEIYQQQDD